MRGDDRASRLPDSPAADRDQRETDDAFAVGGDGAERQLVFQEQQQGRDQHHAGSMTDAPLKARFPPFDSQTSRASRGLLAQGKWRDRSEMIRAGEDVQEARGETREEGNHPISGW